MPHKNRDNLGRFLPNTPTASNNQSSLFFGGYELEEPLGEQPNIFGEPIPTEPMAKKRNDIGNRERVEGVFPIKETNGILR